MAGYQRSLGFATAFFPRLLSYFGVSSLINFVHFLVIPVVFVIAILTTRIQNTKQITIVWELMIALGIFLVCTIASALINEAGAINVFLQYMLQAEPFLLLIALMSIPLRGRNLQRFRNWLFLSLISSSVCLMMKLNGNKIQTEK